VNNEHVEREDACADEAVVWHEPEQLGDRDALIDVLARATIRIARTQDRVQSPQHPDTSKAA